MALGATKFNAPAIVPDFSAGMPTVAPAGGAITPEAAPMSPIDTLKEVFFDIRDGIETLVQSGVTAVVQPSGSIRDKEIIKFANETNTILVFSNTRHFRH